MDTQNREERNKGRKKDRGKGKERNEKKYEN